MTLKKKASCVAKSLLLGTIAGCGGSSSDFVSISNSLGGNGIGALPQTALSEAEDDSTDPNPKAKVVNKSAMPSPERTNPFELSGAFREEESGEMPGRKKEIRVLGFVEVDEPMVMLSIDGRTHTMKAGQSDQRVTVLEVHQPNVRLSYDGVTWNASLFDQRKE